jgi:hypothetical protein
MGQKEILEFLNNKRSYTDDFFSAKEISKALMESHQIRCANIHSDLMKLVVFNFVEWKGNGIWNHRKLFRGKK